MYNLTNKPINIYRAKEAIEEKLTDYFWKKGKAKKKSEKKLNNYLKTHLDKALYILHYIYFVTVVNRKEMCEDYIPISNQQFEKLIGRHYYSIMEFLHEHFIENDGYYIYDKDSKETGKCLGYRFKKEFYINTDFFQTTINNKDFEDKLKKIRNEKFNNIDQITHLIEESLQKLSINTENAMESVIRKANTDSLYLLNKYPGNLKRHSYTINNITIPSLKLISNSKDLQKLRFIKNYNRKNDKKKRIPNRLRPLKVVISELIAFKTSISSRTGSINRIQNKEQSANRPTANSRVHTNITNMASGLRPFLYLDQQPEIELVSLDVSNSQPFVLIKIILDFIQGRGYMLDDTTNLYINLVCEGRFYSYMKVLLNSMDDDKFFKTKMFGRIFYDNHTNCVRTNEWTVFSTAFPIVAQAIVAKKQYDFKKLSIEMQAIEAQINIDGVLAELYNKFPGTFFTHIHDSIIFPAGYESIVKDLIIKHYQRVVGYSPNIKPAEYLNNQYLKLAA